MTRIKTFAAAVAVPRMGPPPETIAPWVEDALVRQLSGPLKGPRGGRYEPIGDIYGRESGEAGSDFMFGQITYVARRKGRYVRPSR